MVVHEQDFYHFWVHYPVLGHCRVVELISSIAALMNFCSSGLSKISSTGTWRSFLSEAFMSSSVFWRFRLRRQTNNLTWLTWLMSSGVLELSWLSRSSCPSLQSWILCFPFQFLALECPSSWGLVFLAFAYHVLESSEVVWRLVPVDFFSSLPDLIRELW